VPIPVLSLMLVVFSLTTGEFVIAGILPEVSSDLSVPVATAGLLVTAYAVGMIVGFTRAAAERAPQHPEPDVIRHLRNEQRLGVILRRGSPP